jgi:uracil-DNA glycosylase
LSKVKAVILGQDPYHNHNQAHGLCFSVRPPTPAPPSLKNMYTAIKKDYPSFTPPPKNGGLLTPWADRGVLLLNTCLTVEAHKANSHANKGWEKLTGKVVETVNRVRQGGVVFLAWGAPAQKKCASVSPRHLVLKSVHPSPLSAYKELNGANFVSINMSYVTVSVLTSAQFDSHHFKKANEWLKGRYGDDGVIDWDLNVDPAKAGT